MRNLERMCTVAKGAEARGRSRKNNEGGNDTVYWIVFIIPLHTKGISYKKIKILNFTTSINV